MKREVLISIKFIFFLSIGKCDYEVSIDRIMYLLC